MFFVWIGTTRGHHQTTHEANKHSYKQRNWEKKKGRDGEMLFPIIPWGWMELIQNFLIVSHHAEVGNAQVLATPLHPYI